MGRSTFSGPVAGAYAVVTVFLPGTLSAGDGAAKWIAPLDCKLVHVGAHLGDAGSTSGSTSIQVSSGATDYLSSTLDIAYDDADSTGETTSFTSQAISKGDLVEIDIDAVPSTASADLTVHLSVFTTGHTTSS